MSVTLLLSGCIREDMSNCPPAVNLSLTFSYTGDTQDATMFGKMIDCVTLYCFDTLTDELVKTQTIDKDALNIFQGTDLYLAPGNYKIISWANAMSDTQISGSTLFSGRVNYPGFPEVEKIPTNDHLYYGEYDVTTPASGVVSGDIPHKGAHINMEVYVEGAGFKNQPSTWPTIEMSNLMPQYTMQMADARPYATTYYPTGNWLTMEKIFNGLALKYQVLRFDDLNNIMVSVIASDGKLMNSVKLQDFMNDNSITVNNKNEVTVSILFQFSDLGVTITLPDWTKTPVDPEI